MACSVATSEVTWQAAAAEPVANDAATAVAVDVAESETAAETTAAEMARHLTAEPEMAADGLGGDDCARDCGE